MKNIIKSLLVILVFIFAACSGSDTYRGAWKATDLDGGKFEMSFDAKNFEIKDSTGSSQKYEYSQNSVNIKNGVKTYGIRVGDGRSYEIHFPYAKDESLAILKDGNGTVLYAMSRTEYVDYNTLYKLK